MNRFSEDHITDRVITVPLGNQGRDLRKDLLRAADTVIIKARDSRLKRKGQRLCVWPAILMGIVAALCSVILALIVLIMKT